MFSLYSASSSPGATGEQVARGFLHALSFIGHCLLQSGEPQRNTKNFHLVSVLQHLVLSLIICVSQERSLWELLYAQSSPRTT
jgi:hypothetical protein